MDIIPERSFRRNGTVKKRSLLKTTAIIGVSLVLIATTFVFGGGSAGAVGPSPFFELDSTDSTKKFNIVRDDGAVDWSGSATTGVFGGGSNFVNKSTTPVRPTFISTDPSIVAEAFVTDALASDSGPGACSGDNSVYTGAGGETNNEALSTMTWGSGSVPPKDEIANAYAIARNATTTGMEVFFGAERIVNNGDSHIDFEFLQSRVTTTGSCSAGGGFLGNRTRGDLLVSVDFTSGGTAAEPQLYKWNCGAAPVNATTGVCNPAKGARPQAQYLLATGTELASVKFGSNPQPIACGDWVCRGQDGSQVTTVASNAFMEGGIDLSDAGFTGCISTFLPHTRSSASFTATLKDFGGPLNFNTCKKDISIVKVDSRDASVKLAATFKLVKDTDSTAGASAGDTVINNTAGGATCVTSATTPFAGTCLFQVASPGNYYAVETIAPAGYQLAQPVLQVVTAADFNTTTALVITVRDTPAPGTINVHKQDDADDPDTAAVEGNPIEGVKFRLYPDKGTIGGTYSVSVDVWSSGTAPFCTTNATGDCQFTSVEPGDYWVVEDTTTLPTGIAAGTPTEKAVTLGLGTTTAGASVTVTFINPRTFKIIVLVCKEQGNKLYPSQVALDSDQNGTADTAKTSLAASGLVSGGATEAEVCGLTGARYLERRAGTYDKGSVVIPVNP